MTGSERFAEMLRVMFVRECREDRAVAESRGNPLPGPADPGAEFDRWLHGALAQAYRQGAEAGALAVARAEITDTYEEALAVEAWARETAEGLPCPYDITGGES